MPEEKVIPQRKIDEVAELHEKLSKSSIAIATSYAKVSVADMTKMRKELRSKGIEYRVVKNSLAERAAKSAGKQGLTGIMIGSTGLVMGSGDVSETAKTFTSYLRSSKIAISLNGAVMDGKVLKPSEIEVLANLPPKNVLIAQIAGLILGPVTGLARAVNSGAYGLALALQARSRQLEEQTTK
ncbi:MAG: 50S ribosomal protein L10 [Dehalococcoidia bacterium]|nr:50S ribosomal protein L10 [Dehalococcoidia bacterium]